MTLPLFERFPGTASLPRVELASVPTPLEQLDPVKGVSSLWVKRDDLTNGIYGGNKVRKLDFLLGDALASGSKAVLTFGAYGSNHALATAVHASRLGLEPHVVLSPQEPGPFAAATLRAHAGIGTVIHLVDGWDGARAAVLARQALAQRDGVEPYTIPMGGTNALGAVGYVNAALELVEQTGEDVVPDVVYVALGTVGTAVGLAVGFALAQVPTRVIAVRVTPESVGSAAIAARMTADTLALLRSVDATVPELDPGAVALDVRDEWFEPGYGIVTPQTTRAVDVMGERGIRIETTYTGKAVAALLDDAANGGLEDARVAFWDTYNSAPMPAPGRDDVLPPVLREYIATCDALFGGARGTQGESS